MGLGDGEGEDMWIWGVEEQGVAREGDELDEGWVGVEECWKAVGVEEDREWQEFYLVGVGWVYKQREEDAFEDVEVESGICKLFIK